VTTFNNKNELLRFMLLGKLRITIWLTIPPIQRRRLRSRMMHYI